ncbi:MAG: flagellar basal-body rod protein FlgG [Phenylobacterium sp.]|jgi:flagellar basal-body rod protein FlgG|uniref:flagellar basal-body rod protein FlgG n=1 Tax=Phenylobacterium sp. TaxID=1871053 RepID=UPI002A2904B7|nr:flagellar basal-body rod protein FlgG [Phenylobacterium sp.]MDD3837925.1 flagellar basal-body rod protein FlgG [Phenylobacterium sp.]MDX9997689.1 flagellar basal-body rod protein FlgG [Phenylobacterium sp.]
MQALRTAATGMSAQQLNVDLISNNIANMNTVGFKRQRAEFQDLLYQTLEMPGAQSSDQGTVVPTGVQIGAGVKAGSTYRIHQQGALTRTENPYDLAIGGRGFFQVQLPSGEIGYTRAGNFSVNAEGQLVTEDGYLIEPAITIPQEAVSVTISKSGQVQAALAGETEPQVLGQIELATFVNDAGLMAIGDNLYLETPASGQATLGVPGLDGIGELIQGHIEASNVDAVSEITALIVAQRAYEMNSKVISTADEMLQTANQVTR